MEAVAVDQSKTSPGSAKQHLTRSGMDFLFPFHAMATPCEVRIETDNVSLAQLAADIVETEARRIEFKYSRYKETSVVSSINTSGGREVVVDAETAHLLNFAAQCYELSNGLFDVTSGILRRAWKFDGSDRVPTSGQIKSLRVLIGWHKVDWKPPVITLPVGMEIDFGGLAKEYAVDKALAALREVTALPTLINFGGDLRVSGPRLNHKSWNVAIEQVDRAGEVAGMLELADGALATSGDSRRFVLKDGVRYGHILNPRTGAPVKNAPRSVTVAAATCVEAGVTATLATLQGKQAECFLKREGVRAWCIR